MKRFLITVLVFAALLSLVSCGEVPKSTAPLEEERKTASVPISTEEEKDPPSSTSEESGSEQMGGALPAFRTGASIFPTVLVDENGVKITATALSYNSYSAELELTFENDSEQELSFVSNSLGYSCNSVNGMMVAQGYVNCDVKPGKKAKDKASFSFDELRALGIFEIADIEIGFDISDPDYQHRYTGPRKLITSAADGYDYEKNLYRETVAGKAAQNTFGYTVEAFTEKQLAQKGSLSVCSAVLMKNKDGERALLLEVVNEGTELVRVAADRLTVNGLSIRAEYATSHSVAPGKRAVVNAEFPSYVRTEYALAFGVENVKALEVEMIFRDENGKSVGESFSFGVIASEEAVSPDQGGKEVFRSEELCLISKGIFASKAEYNDDMYAVFLVENLSDKTVTLDDVYDSVSVNGFMNTYTLRSVELAKGEKGLLEVKLFGSSLKENGIAKASDVTELELGLTVKEGKTLLAEPLVTVSY